MPPEPIAITSKSRMPATRFTSRTRKRLRLSSRMRHARRWMGIESAFQEAVLNRILPGWRERQRWI